MRILFISNLYPPEVLGGYEILCARVVASFKARGHEVAVLTTAVKGQTALTARNSGPVGEKLFRTLRLSLSFGKKARLARSGRQSAEGPNARATRDALRDFKPDLVFVWSQLRLGLAAARESEAEGFPTVYTMNDDHVLGFMPGSREGIKGLLRSFIEDIVYPASTWTGLRLDPVVSISETVRSRLASEAPRFASSKIAMQGVPLELFPLKADIGAAHKPFRVLYAGQLHRYKGVHTLVEAVALAGKADFALTVAGAGDPAYEAQLKARAGELGLDARFLGRVAADTMGELYREADALAFTSVWDEPFGLTHLEAMASGTPVASVGHGGPGEFLVDDVNALIFGKEDNAGLAGCLRRFSDDESLRRRIALAGRDTVVREFSIERYADRLENILIATIAEARP
ncbi:MAG: glycosyltransferase family 4 protein [Rectinemataceae bacterium]